MLDAPTVFIGDSITVGVTSFVPVSGTKTMVAVGGLGSSDILGIAKTAEANGKIANQKYMVVLGGTNDIGNLSRPVSSVFAALSAIWAMGKAHNMRVIALTVPPAKGYSGFPNYPPVEARRQQLNALIKSAPNVDQAVDLDALIGSPTDPSHLAPAFDSADHLHPNMKAFGAALGPVLTGVSAVQPTPGVTPPAQNIIPTAAGLHATVKLGAEVAATGGLIYGGYRLLKHWGWF